MAPKRRTATITTTSSPMPDAQLKALIARGVVDALAERDADRSRNGDDSHDSGGTEGVVGLTQWLEKMESVFHISNCTVACQELLIRLINSPPRGIVNSPPERIVNSPPKGIVNSPPEGIVNSPPKGIVNSPPEGIVNSPPEGIINSP
ncbi:hypothetical protein Tco_1215939 [Tanacetum coccineum]